MALNLTLRYKKPPSLLLTFTIIASFSVLNYKIRQLERKKFINKTGQVDLRIFAVVMMGGMALLLIVIYEHVLLCSNSNMVASGY